MDISVNEIIAYIFYVVIISIGGYIAKQYKAHSKQLIELKEIEEKRAQKLLGEQNYEKARQIVVDGVYRTEQLAKEMMEEKWNSLDKRNKTLQYVSEQLQKVGIQISQEDICNIIKATVGHMNINNH
ncbi:hypothetical protein NL50_14960 [Clostridium acetobutylicum]|nr:hypothetical protein NL50_14960 [Clostridium acetobutylicum]